MRVSMWLCLCDEKCSLSLSVVRLNTMRIGFDCLCAYVFVEMCVCMFTSIQCCFEGHLEKVEWQKSTKHAHTHSLLESIQYICSNILAYTKYINVCVLYIY